MKTSTALHAHTESTTAFTRLELAAVLAGLGFLVLLTLPALAGNRERSARVLCGNNLRILGEAYARWGTEHSGRVPCRTPWWEGGVQTYGTPPAGSIVPTWLTAGFQNNAWFQFAQLSNEVTSAKALVCPSDAEKVPAKGWGSNADGGFLHPNYQNKAASYLISLDLMPTARLGLLSGDRNLNHDSISQGCSSGVAPCASIVRNSTVTRIGGGLHVAQGNFLFTDGRVEELTSKGFSRRFPEVFPADDNGAFHYITP